MDVSHHGPYDQGYTRATMVHTKRSDLAIVVDLIKCVVVRIRSLQLDSMKSESLVIVDLNATVNTFPGLVHTARHTMEWVAKEVGKPNLREGAYHFVIHDWGEVVTR